jgi:hypothetical protein
MGTAGRGKAMASDTPKTRSNDPRNEPQAPGIRPLGPTGMTWRSSLYEEPVLNSVLWLALPLVGLVVVSWLINR